MSRETYAIIVYTIIVALSNIFFPLMYAVNWYHFFDPWKNGFVPYVDFQVGYPVLGFVPYGLLSFPCPSILVYGYVMRYVNLALLALSFLILYKVVEIYRGRKDALLTLLAMMLSISIIAANPYSNDVMALFFSSLALLFMMKENPVLCGFSTGLAIFAKLYPLILLPLSLAFFREWKSRFALLVSLILSVLLLNLPFLVLNPYVWSETFIGGNTGRGPWETVWALMSGYHSHGGVEAMHPYFEGFFTYKQLQQIYPPSPADHAYYLYSNSGIPLAMNLLLLLSFIVPLLLFKREKILELIGLCGALFLLASKGYSPEFTIFALPLLAISVQYKSKFVLTLLLDVATVLQMMNWSGWFAPFEEGILLPYAVILRTGVFLLAIFICFRNATIGSNIRKLIMVNVRSFLRNLSHSLQDVLTNKKMIKKVVLFFTLILLFSLFFQIIYGKYGSMLTSYDKKLKLDTDEISVMTLTHGLEERIYVSIPKSLSVMVNATDSYVENLNMGDTTRIFLVPFHEGKTDVYFKLLYPITSFIIDEAFIDGDIKKIKGSAKFQQENYSLIVTAKNSDSKRYYMLTLSWPVNFTVNGSTKISADLTHVNGYLQSVVLDLVDEKSSFYRYELITNVSRSVSEWHRAINATSIDISGKNLGDFYGRKVSAINLVTTIEPGKFATVKLDVLSYYIGNENVQLPIKVQDSIDCDIKVYVGEFFKLKNLPAGVIVWSIPIIAILYFNDLVKGIKNENINNKRYNGIFRC